MSILILILSVSIIAPFNYGVAGTPRFRILAPQIICPKDGKTPIEKPNYTVITIQTDADAGFLMNWTIRWQLLRDPTQRFTVMIWRTVRALEAKLNGPQPEPFIYVINDDELLYGVNYIFTVTVKTPNGDVAKPKSFYINNTFGDPTLEAVNGYTDSMSVILAGGQDTYTDIIYVLEAEVTTCVSMHDYHFIWNVYNEDLKEALNISTTGSRLELTPYLVQPGLIYDVTCYIIKDNTEEVITQVELPFEVGYRGLEVYLSIDRLIVGIDHSLTIHSAVINHDYFGSPLTYQWECLVNERPCDFLEHANESNLILLSGLPVKGQYDITVIVGVLQQSAKAKATIIAVDSIIPVIQLEPVPRLINQDTTLLLTANISNVMPTCTLMWYFATEEQINTTNKCDDWQHGSPITEPLTIFSLEETFLSELIDYTNDTESRQVTAEMKAAVGRARLLAECNCSMAFDCGTKQIAYADVYFKLNVGPEPNNVSVSPSSGTALETIFRISTGAAKDPESPLTYIFYCALGGGTEVWVSVCDIREACSKSETKIVYLQKGKGRSMEILKSDIRAHIKRCEIILLQRSAIAAIVTYYNAGQTELLELFTRFLLDSVPKLSPRCISRNYHKYLDFLNQLVIVGMDTSDFV